MPNYRRWYLPGGTYFFTLVSCNRYPFFLNSIARRLLFKSYCKVRVGYPFELVAWVLLPDHLHAICRLPSGDADFSSRLRRLKKYFTEEWIEIGGHEEPVSTSRRNKNERGIWQRRFYEHLIEDERNFENCVNYIHFNPVKHNCVSRPRDWKWSSFHRFVKAGDYSIDWGRQVPESIKDFSMPE